MRAPACAPGDLRLEPLVCWLPPGADDGPAGRPPLEAVRSGLGDLLRRHPAAGPERRLEPLRWAITAVDPVRGLRIEGVLLIMVTPA